MILRLTFPKMNKIDRERYNYLKVLSRIPRNDNYDKYRTEYIKDIKDYMKGTVWNELHKLGYVNSSSSTPQIVTEEGMKLLRMLEDIRRKDLTLILSVIAITLSIVSLILSV